MNSASNLFKHEYLKKCGSDAFSYEDYELYTPFTIEILAWHTPALALRMQIALGAMLERFMTVTNIIEEMDLVFVGKESGTDTMNGSITPTLLHKE